MANKPKNWRGRKPSTKSRDNYKPDDRIEREASHKFNDVSWYVKNDAMLRDSASLSFNNPLGQTIKMKDMWEYADIQYSIEDDFSLKSIPGMMSFRFIPGFGISENSSSPANIAAQNIYTYVRYMNSGSKNYDQADLMLYLLAMDSLYMFWNWAKRIYGYARIYSQKNRYMPRVYAAADGIDLDNIVANLSDYRLWLNSIAAQISSFCVPAVMPLFIRHSWMVSNIYTDSLGAKAQQYYFAPNGFYCYDETGSEYGGQLLFLETPAPGLTRDFEFIRTLGKRMLDAVAYSEDIGVMSGDILKAYGQEKLFKLSPVDPDYQVLPAYNEEVLTQIENLTTSLTNHKSVADKKSNSKLYKDEALTVTQDPNTGYLKWNPQILPSAFTRKKAFLNMHKDEVSPADVMVATRLTTFSNGGAILAMGTEYVDRMYIHALNSSGSISNIEISSIFDLGDMETELGREVYMGNLPLFMAIGAFQRHPFVTIITKYNGNYQFVGTSGDFDNYTVVDVETMQQMHETAILSEFNIPQIGSF